MTHFVQREKTDRQTEAERDRSYRREKTGETDRHRQRDRQTQTEKRDRKTERDTHRFLQFYRKACANKKVFSCDLN